MIGDTKNETAQGLAARAKELVLFPLRRRFRNRLRRGKSRGIKAPGKLRPEWEMDNFFCSHRCTSYVRLWSGARRCLPHLRVPLRYFFAFVLRGFFL